MEALKLWIKNNWCEGLKKSKPLDKRSREH